MRTVLYIFVFFICSVAAAVPPVTSGLVLCLDGNSAQTISYQGKTLVSCWNDQAVSDGTNNATQSSTSYMPELMTVSGFANNKPVLYFDGNDKFTIADNDNLDPMSHGLTIIIVGKVNDVYPRIWLRKGNTDSTKEGYSFWTDDHERDIFRVNADGTSKAGIKRDQQPGRQISVFNDLAAFTLGIGSSSISGYVNNISTDWESFISYSYSGTIDDTNVLEIGCGQFKGYLAEVIIYNKLLSASERLSVNTYLANKYNLLTSEKDSTYDFWAVDDKAAYLLNIDANEYSKFEAGHNQGLLEIKKVYIPYSGQNLLPGWPVAVADTNNVCLMYRDNDMRLSNDGGILWGTAIDMEDTFIETPNTNAVKAGMQAVGKLSNDEMMLIDWKGVMKSTDKGVTWSLIPDAFTSSQLSSTLNNGPKIIEHSYWGLIVFPVMDSNFIIRYSRDGGTTWEEYTAALPGGYANTEACAITYGNSIIALSRNNNYATHQSFNDGSDYGTYQYVQLWSVDGHTSFQAALTNMKATGLSYGSGLWGQDTVDLSLNPVNGRLEALVVNRLGGRPGDENDLTLQTLNLWSIDPAALLAGSAEWRFEGTLLTRKQHIIMENCMTLRVEGLHPAASVIDTKKNMQHIYVYAGVKNIVYGVYRISRSLDTEKLSEFLKKNQASYCLHSKGQGIKYDVNEDCVVDYEDLRFLTENWIVNN